MGTLKPNATYIYERVDNVTYAREFGSDPSTRVAIGMELSDDAYFKNIAEKYFFEKQWPDIIRAAETNPTLKEALNRVIILYHLSKDNGKE